MKYINLIAFYLIIGTCSAQETNILLKQEIISDLSETPIYSQLTEDIDGETKWKSEYQYLDSIEIYRISYLSDGLRIEMVPLVWTGFIQT